MKKVYIIGRGQTKRGYFAERDLRNLVAEATFKALDDAHLDISQIGQAWLSHYPTTTDMQMTAGQVVVDAIGASARFGCIHIEEACTSGGQAIHDAFMGIASGIYKTGLVIGVAKMLDSFDYLNSFGESGYSPFGDRLGIRLNIRGSSLGYKRKYEINQDDYASFIELEYFYATKNPISMIYGQKPKGKEDFFRAPYRFYPDRPGIFPTACDGASAIILANEDIARQVSDEMIRLETVVHIEESSYYSHSLDYSYGTSPTPHFLEKALKTAFNNARAKPEELDVFQPHDCTIETAWSYLNYLGHPDIPEGYGPKFISKGGCYPWGRLPALTCGSAKGGQPRGPIALDYVIENCYQLLSQAQERQVPLKNYIAASGTSPRRPTVIIIRREK